MGKPHPLRLTIVAGIATIFAMASVSVAAAQSSNAIEVLSSTVKEIYRDHRNAVVRVKAATQTIEEGETKTSLLVFSGFFISADGKVLTNAIPEDGSSRVWVEIEGLSYLANIVASDERSNTALLQLVNLPARFSYATVSDNAPDLEIGDFAFSVTSPLDFSPTPKFGLVTGFESHFGEIEFPFTYTRLGIPIGPAEGGSPVFNDQGELAGIAIATLPEVGSSYIVPAKALNRVVADMIEHKRVRYGVLPIEFERKGDRYNLEREIVVKSVVGGSPAAQAGLRKNDVLVSVDNQMIDTLNQLRDLIFFKSPGEFLLIKVKRDAKMLEFAILLEPVEDHNRKQSGDGG